MIDGTIIRPAVETDLGYIIESWLKTYRRIGFMKYVSDDVYWSWYKMLVKHRLAMKNVDVMVTVTKADPDTIIGWLCYEPDGIHYAVTRSAFRNSGVMTAMINKMPKKPVWYSHLTKPGASALGNMEFLPNKIY